jgi:cytochrome P450
MKARVAQSDVEKSKPENDASIRKDFFYWLTRAKDPQTGEGYTMPEMWAESRLLITAGSDTSSITIAAAFFYLLRNPSALEALQSELRGSFSSAEEIVSGPQLSACHYLRAVIDETLRLAPPVPSSLPRQVLAGGMIVDEDYFPEGAIVGTSAYAIHHSEKYYPDPWAFKPDRWIAPKSEQGAEAEALQLAKSAFCPFSLGSRGCIGKSMAYAELSIALGKVFYMYDVRLASGDVTGAGKKGGVEEGRRREGEFQLRDLFVSGRDGPVVEFKLHV